LRKIASLLLGLFLAFTLGYLLLHPSFLLIADWLSPVLGTHLYALLTAVYLLLGDPIGFAPLTAIWGGVSFLGGVIIRRRVGAALTTLLVFLLFIPVLAVSVFGVYQAMAEIGFAGGGANPLEALPPLPRGLSIAHVFEAPVLGRVIETFLGTVQGGPPPGQGIDILMALFGPILMDLALKPVIIIVAALIGVEVGRRLVEPALKPFEESLRIRLGGKPRTKPGDVWGDVGKIASCVIMIGLLVSSASPIRAGPAPEDFYAEAIIGALDGRGRAHVADLFIESGDSILGDAGGEETEGLLAAVMLSHEGIAEPLLEMGNFTSDLGLGQFLNLVPPTVMVAVYADVPQDVAELRADSVSSAFSELFDTRLSGLAAFSPPIHGENTTLPQLTFVLYQSSARLEELSEGYQGNLPGRGGLADILLEVSDRGVLIPGMGPESADGSLLMSGFVNLDALFSCVDLGELPFDLTDFIPTALDGPVSFSGGVSFWDHGVASTGEGYVFDVLDLLGFGGSAGFSGDSDISIVLLTAPNGTDTGGERSNNLKVTTTLNLAQFDPQYLNLTMQGDVMTKAPGADVEPSRFQISFSGVTLPLNVEVSKEVSPAVVPPRGVVTVTVTVKNNDARPMLNVGLDDGSTISGYPLSARLVSGSTSASLGSIGPGESKTLTYSVRLGEGGVYTLPPAEAGYTCSGGHFREPSNGAEARVARPSPLSMGLEIAAMSWTGGARLLDMLTGGNGHSVMAAATLLILATLAFMEYRNLRKWLAGASPENLKLKMVWMKPSHHTMTLASTILAPSS